MDEITRTFERYDIDRNGYISYDEAHQVLHGELGLSIDRTKKLIKIYDRNGDGRLSYEEFIWFYWKIQEKKEEMSKLFKKFDEDNNNAISFQEAKKILLEFNFSDTEIHDLISLHDTNQDGQLQYEEFVHFWNDCGGRANIS